MSLSINAILFKSQFFSFGSIKLSISSHLLIVLSINLNAYSIISFEMTKSSLTDNISFISSQERFFK